VLARTTTVHNYFIGHLERSFGRSVEVRRFSALLFPAPLLEADQITVGEDAQFGNEYFLRADHLRASFRWSELLQGHFEFGTLSFTRPSLTLVHNETGGWNLERWLPPPIDVLAKDHPLFNGPQLLASSANRLERIDIDEGRIDFKAGDDKVPFAFTGVSGTVQQVSRGRWRVELRAQPWRSGVTLQSTGMVFVRGEVAGTSARLQPAEIHVHWEDVSLADLFRLFHGQDYGVRGLLTVDGVAKSAVSAPAAATSVQVGEWSYSVQARARHIHRWDLTERSDNPSVNITLEGRWNTRARTATAEHVLVQTPNSNLRGNALLSTDSAPSWELHVDSAGIQAKDLLAWYRAFHPDVDEGVTAEQFFTGTMTLRGWPLELRDTAFSSGGGELRIPGLDAPVRVGAFSGGRQRTRLIAGPVRLSYGTRPLTNRKSGPQETPAKRRSTEENRGFVDIAFADDFGKHSGTVAIDGRLETAQDALTFAAAFGRRLNHGWELLGPASAGLRYDWDAISVGPAWNGRIDVTNATLKAVGLNQPLKINKARLEWTHGTRTAQISAIDGFGALWSGEIKRAASLDSEPGATWNFQLHANHLVATDLDRWIGPRARPNWFQRILPSLLSGLTTANNSASGASELLRRINAEGELRVDEFTLEKLKIDALRADVSLHDLRLDVKEADARWADGRVRGRVQATFWPRPSYDVTARLEHVNLAQLPAPEHGPEPFAGLASGSLHFTTQGVGREELLQNLNGKGEVKLRDVEFNSWDVSASVLDGQRRAGASRWVSGEASFSIRDRGIILSALRLESGPEITLVTGTVNFGQQTDLTIQVASAPDPQGRTSEGRRVMKVSGPLELPRISVEKAIVRQPAD
jgi:AsmA-like C-terminal region